MTANTGQQMAAHTPGPWTLFCHEGSGARYIDAGAVQMQISRTSDAGAAEMDANAHLIAAAPRLLVALQECHELLATICEVCADNPPPGGLDKLENARRAIAEATGTQEWANG